MSVDETSEAGDHNNACLTEPFPERCGSDEHRDMSIILTERFLRRTLIVIALGGLVLGLLTWAVGRAELANWIWAAGTVPVVVGLLISMIRDLLGGSHGS